MHRSSNGKQNTGLSNLVFKESRSRIYKIMQASPHLRRSCETANVMRLVLLALMPAVLGSVYLFGPAVLPYYAVGIVTACIADSLCGLLRRRKYRFDYSPVITGLLLAMSLPLGAPLWFPALGAVVAIIVAKNLFGGIGRNFLNPALTGRLVLRALFSAEMLKNAWPNPPFNYATAVDAISAATPLMRIKQGTGLTNVDLWQAFIGLSGGKIGETSAFLLFIGGLFLIWKKVIPLRLPLSMFAGIALMAFFFGDGETLINLDWRMIVGYLLGGSTFLVAFFMITDYASSPDTRLGQWLFGFACGVLIMVFRLWSPYPEGATFAVLIMNFTVPALNYFLRPRVLGERGFLAYKLNRPRKFKSSIS